MKLGELSTTQVISIRAGGSIDRAIELMEEYGIHHLPVLSEGKVVGMLSDRDILTAVGWERSERRHLRGGALAGPRQVIEIMSRPVYSLSPDDNLRTATDLMIRRKIHAVPLVHKDRLAGLITTTDLLQALIAAPQFTKIISPLLREPLLSYTGTQITTVNPKTPMDELVDLLREKWIRHLPVVVGDELLGMISDRDIRRAFGRASVQDAQAQERGEFYMGPSEALEIMTTSVKTMDSSATLGQAIDEMLSNEIHSLPVMDDRRLVGMLTDTDILRIIGEADRMS